MTACAWHSLRLVVAIIAMGFYTAQAQAATGVATLGVRSQDGEDELERRLSAALRASAKAVEGFAVGDRELSLEQMSLAHGCDEPDAKCLSEIARTLTVDKLIFGHVVGSSAGYELSLSAFDTATNRVETLNARNISPDLLAPATVGNTVSKVLLRLLGGPSQAEVGTLRIEGGAPRSDVLVDGDTRATLDEAGSLSLELPAGNHTVRPAESAPGDVSERVALVEAGAVATVQLAGAEVPVAEEVPSLPAVEAEPEAAAPPSRNLRRMFGWGAVGVGAAFAVATIYSWIRIERINKDDSYNEYRDAWPRAGTMGGVDDVCANAARGALAMRNQTPSALERKADQLCSEADTLETLQYVFLAGTVVSAGVGTYLLLTSRDRPAKTLSLQPRVGVQSAGLAATLTF